MNENDKQAEPVAWANEIIDDLQGLFDTDGITHEDSGDALIYLSQAISSVKDAAKRQGQPVQPNCGACLGDGTVCRTSCQLADESPAQPAAWMSDWQDGSNVDFTTKPFVAATWVENDYPIQPLYTHPAQPVAADHSGLIKRIDAAIERVTQGRGLMSIPADPRSDVDLVLSECKALLQGENPPFWATDFHPAQPVQPDDLRQAALIDLAYINGAKAGWNMCVADDESQFQKLTEGVAECVNVLKNTRSQATPQPVQPAVEQEPFTWALEWWDKDGEYEVEYSTMGEFSFGRKNGFPLYRHPAQPVQPAGAINDRLLSVARKIRSSLICETEIDDELLVELVAAIAEAEAEKAKGGV